jgi:hypothetical protein
MSTYIYQALYHSLLVLTSSSRERLPYLDALIMETMRWWIIATIAIPHRLREDDVYNGELIIRILDFVSVLS